MHASGNVLGKADVIKWAMSGDINKDKVRVLFENDEIGVEHSFVTFNDGNKEAVMAVYKYKDGKVIDDLGVYMTSLLNNFKEYLNYYDPDTSIGQDEITVSGGHGGIGSISNVFGEVKVEKVSRI